VGCSGVAREVGVGRRRRRRAARCEGKGGRQADLAGGLSVNSFFAFRTLVERLIAWMVSFKGLEV
jgi:hypothetical protein